MAKRKPSQGAKKTETLTLRLDPKAKFTIDLLARIRRQSITAVIEAAIDEIAYDQDVKFNEDGKNATWSLGSAITEIWSTDEAERFINLCYFMPDLLTHEELRIWETITSSECFYADSATRNPTHWKLMGVSIDVTRLRAYWDYLLEHMVENSDSRTVVPFEPPF